nr:MAG TPA: hypothetical protein [Caudoviricetes sp.]
MHKASYDTVNDSDVSIFPLCFNDNIALHKIICPYDFLSASIE